MPRVVTSALEPTGIKTCAAFKAAFHVDLAEFCEDVNKKDRIGIFPGIKVISPMDVDLDENTRMYFGANYLMHLKSIPERAVYLGVGHGDSKKKALIVPLHGTSSLYQRVDVVSLVENYLETCTECGTISLSDELSKLQKSLSESDSVAYPETGLKNDADTHLIRIENRFQKGDLSLDQSHFVLPADDYFDFQACNTKKASDKLRHQLNATSKCRTYDNSNKYFHEAQLIGSADGLHSDWRFFRKSTYSVYEHQVIMHRMARAWLQFAGVANLTTWLAHGTLLGWYWNGVTMPWDQDMDVQMTMDSLFILGRNYNQSVVVDVSDADSAYLYFVDVSPHIFDRVHGNGNNVIDARFIDMNSGMYVDITGLAVLEDFQTNSLADTAARLHKVFDTEYTNVIKSALVNPTYLSKYLPGLQDTEEKAWKNGHLYNCKDFHFYTMLELQPLRRTIFEGEQAYVPANFDTILKREYNKGMIIREYGNWVFRPFLGLWVAKGQCKRDTFGSECQDKNVLLEERVTRPIRLTRKKWFGVDGLNSVRPDPWLMNRNEKLWSE